MLQGSFSSFNGFSNSNLVIDDSNLTAEVRVIVKKLSKRDSITKQRALEELRGYLLRNQEKEFVSIWDKLFNKLAIDHDRKVRECTFGVMDIIASEPKLLQPILKKIAGTWFLSRFDSSKEVSQNAIKTFEKAFPNKLNQVLKYCHEDILNFVTKLILEEKPETLSDKRFVSAEEMQEKYVNCVSAGFDLVGFLVEQIDVETRKQMLKYDDLFTKPFWALAHHQDATIRCGFYRFIKGACLHGLDILEQHKELVASQYLAKVFGDQSSVTHVYLWDSVLLLTKHIPSVWLQETKKSPLTKLFLFLKKGAYGSASISYPCLLPFLGHVPEELLEKENFQQEFLDSFWKGRTELDRNGMTLFLDSFYECCLYLLRAKPRLDLETIMTIDLLRPLESLLEKKTDRFDSETVSKISAKWIVQVFGISQVSSLIPVYQKKLLDLIDRGGQQGWVLEAFVESKEKNVAVEFWNEAVHQYMIKLMKSPVDIATLYSVLKVKDLVLSRDIVENGLKSVSALLVTDDFVVETLVLLLSKSKPEQSKYWHGVIEKVVILKDNKLKIAKLSQIVDTISQNWSIVFVPLEILDSVILKQLNDVSVEGFADLISRLVSLDNDLVHETTLQTIFGFINDSLKSFNDQVLVIENRKMHSIDSLLIQKVLFVLEVLLQGTQRNANVLIDRVIKKNLFSILLVAHSNPLTVSVLNWNEPSTLAIDAAIERIRHLGTEILQLIPAIDTTNEQILMYAEELIEQYQNMNHVGSPADFIEMISHLLEKLQDSKDLFISTILQSPEFYMQFYDYFNSESCITGIVEPISIWSHSVPVQKVNIKYDYDGLSEYSRWILLLISLAKGTETRRFIDTSFYLEITRFVIACQDHLHTTTNLFEVDLLSHTRFVAQDWKDLILQMEMEDFWSLLQSHDSIFGRAFANVLKSKSVIDARIARKLIQLGIDRVGVNNQAIQLILDLYQKKEYVSCLALMEPVLPACDVDLFDQLHPVLGKSVLKMKRNPSIEFADESLSDLIIYGHFLNGIKQSNSEMDSNLRNSVVRWVRTIYDAAVSSKRFTVPDTDALILFDAHMVLIVDYLVKQSIHEHVDYGLNMTRFLCDLAQYWFQIIKRLELNEQAKVFAYNLLILWETLQEAETASDLWIRVSDIENEIEKIIVAMYLIIGAPVESTSVGLQKLQEKMGDIIVELNVESHLHQYTANEAKIFEMIYTNCEHIQKSAFNILHAITGLRVQEHSLSLEMSAKKKKYGLHSSLAELLSRKKPNELFEYFGNGLSFLLLFSHFEGASFDLRQIYNAEIKELKLISIFLESVFDILNVGTKKATINLSKWEFDEYFVQGFDGDVEDSIYILFGHLYFKALQHVPSLVRNWFTDCSSRQLVLAVEQFTEQYFSPLLIAKEFAAVQTQSDNDMVIRINSSQNEITASYKIEEAGLDIIIKLPKSYPLKLAEVTSGSYGGKQAGIQETRWRSWLLSVSSVMIGQNGSISDALVLFKKNVSLHFEGLEDCAICYSIISATDRSTPQKKCRVCKHIFHGSCVYKWFKSSNQNTCPLCRQPF